MSNNTSNYNSINFWEEPRNAFENDKDFLCEMSHADHAFLCGMLREESPKKVVEIGVAEGGTTAIIAKCLNMTGQKAQLFSVDLKEKYYRDESKTTGYYCLDKNITYENVDHKFMLGHTSAYYMEEIGEGIDFVIIDTTHTMPGEFLDFLSVYPFLKKDAVVVLHDVNYNLLENTSNEYTKLLYKQGAIATKVLFGMVKAQKFISIGATYPNIAAIKINENTKDSIIDVFWGLSLPWSYLPQNEYVKEYRDLFQKYYDDEMLKMFDLAVEGNRLQKGNLINSKKNVANAMLKLF